MNIKDNYEVKVIFSSNKEYKESFLGKNLTLGKHEFFYYKINVKIV